MPLIQPEATHKDITWHLQGMVNHYEGKLVKDVEIIVTLSQEDSPNGPKPTFTSICIPWLSKLWLAAN
jgi:hypothetical protein